jgi:hypothetical protein
MIKIINCEECEADFKVSHSLSTRHYKIEFCTFCGARLEEEQQDVLDYDEMDDEDEWN